MHPAVLLLAAILATLAALPARAAVSLAKIFSDHMVLQRDTSAPIWGTAAPGEDVKVTAGSVSAGAKAGADGKWMVKLEKLPMTATGIDVTVTGTNTITLHDVLVGDVWVCSGQSNMQFSMAQTSKATEDLPQTANPLIRLFVVRMRPMLSRQDELLSDKQWVLCDPETAKGFTGVGYYFGKSIAAAEKIPIGLIGTYVGGTTAQAWTSAEGLQVDPTLKKSFGDQAAAAAADAANLNATHEKWMTEGGGKAYKDALVEWRRAENTAKAKNEPAPAKPAPPTAKEPPVDGNQELPSSLFNGMVAPLQPLAIKGVIWYQGESGGSPYAKLFPALITDWRKTWGRGDFPFLFVQLPNYRGRAADPNAPGGWASTREAQASALQLPQTGMAITIEAGDGENLHPPYKGIVGERLALSARHVAYGEDLVHSGPLFDSATAEGAKLIVKFKHTGTGLKIGVPTTQPPKWTPPPTDKVAGFAIAGSDKKFAWAEAVITAPDTVTLTSSTVPDPKYVRYAWGDNPEVNLYNSADLPAGPFRTDSDAPAAAPRPAK